MIAETVLPPQEVSPPPLRQRLVVAFQERLFPSYFKDELTGLGNRAAFNRELDRKVHSQPGNFALIDADLDGLKRENDRYGHDAGDNLIQLAGTIISDSIRAENGTPGGSVAPIKERRQRTPENSEADQVFTAKRRLLGRLARSRGVNKLFRWGGDEYRGIVSGVNDPEVMAGIVERIEKNLLDHGISASIGFAIHEADMSGSTLSSEADAAMYAVKNQHKEEQRRAEIAARPLARQAIFHLGELLTRVSGVVVEPGR